MAKQIKKKAKRLIKKTPKTLEIINQTKEEAYKELYGYTKSEILHMRERLAEHEYDGMAMDDICAIAYKSIHGEYATKSITDVIKEFKKKHKDMEE